MESGAGFAYFEAEITRRVVDGGYKHVLMMGDSMGGSAALLFSHLATRVLAFVPQCELEEYPMCSRRDFTAARRQGFSARLLASVRASSATISVHLGESLLLLLLLLLETSATSLSVHAKLSLGWK